MREEDLLERVGEIGAALRCDGDPDACARSKTCPYHSGHVDHIGFGLGCDRERLERDAAEALEAMSARLAEAEAENDALQAQLGSNDPLTLEELRGMDGEPVWVEFVGKPDGSPIPPLWMLVDVRSKQFVTGTEFVDWREESWFAYRRKPDGGGE